MTALLEPLRLERRPPARAHGGRLLHDWLLVGFLLLVYAGMQSAFVHQPLLSDQLHYFVDAANLPDISWPSHQGLRIGLTIPVWLMIQLFDYSEAAYYAVPYLSMVTLVITTYWLGRILDSRAVGVIAGLMIIANPFVLDDASQLLPDLPATTLMTGAITLLLWQWRRTRATAKLQRTDRIILVAVGVLLGWSYLIREFIVVWFPVVLLVAVVLRLPRNWWRLIAAGLAGVIAFELLWGLVFHDNPFARVVAALNQPQSAPWRVAERAELIASGKIPNTHLEMLTAMPRALVSIDSGWILVGLFVLLMAAGLLLRSPELRLLAAWVLVPMLLLTAVIQFAWLFDNRILRAEKLRYWLPFVPPLVVGGVASLLALGRRLAGDSGRTVAIGLAALVALISVGLTGSYLDSRPNLTRTGQDEYLEFREWAATRGQTCTVIWTDADHWRATNRWLPMYLRSFWGRPIWDGEVRHLNSGDDFVDISELETGALIRARTSLERRNLQEQQIPAYLQDPPSSWRVLLETDRDRVRVLGVGDSTCARP